MSIVSLGDQELVKLYVNGNEKAFELLITRHKDRVYRFILSKIKDPELANDYFQDTFMKVIVTLKGGNYNEEGKFLPWVIRIAHNLVIDHFRKVKRTPVITNSDGFDIFDVIGIADENIEDKMLRAQNHQDLRAFIQLLPEEQKEVLIMRHYADLSFKEIADLTGVSINTALGRMRYALNNLRKMIGDKEVSFKQQ